MNDRQLISEMMTLPRRPSAGMGNHTQRPYPQLAGDNDSVIFCYMRIRPVTLTCMNDSLGFVFMICREKGHDYLQNLSVTACQGRTHKTSYITTHHESDLYSG